MFGIVKVANTLALSWLVVSATTLVSAAEHQPAAPAQARRNVIAPRHRGPNYSSGANNTLATERAKRAQVTNAPLLQRGPHRRDGSPSTTTTTSTCTANPTPTGPAVKTCQAGGGGSDGCLNNLYSVSGSGLTLLGGRTIQPTGDINFQVVDCQSFTGGGSYLNHPSTWKTSGLGIHFEGYGKPGDQYIGKSYFPWSGVINGQLPPAGFCIIWVQVSDFNQHFGEGGQLPACSDQCCVAKTARRWNVPQNRRLKDSEF